MSTGKALLPLGLLAAAVASSLAVVPAAAATARPALGAVARHAASGAVPAEPRDTAPPDPSGNTALTDAFWSDCSAAPNGGPDCDAAALADFDTARAAEGLAPMTLPTGFDALSGPVQLLVLADIDRVDHGLTPVAGLSSALDAYATDGANDDDDPAFPPWTGWGGSNWASPESPLVSEFLWVYDDGVGSGNLDCTQAGDSGCWGHRHNILNTFPAPELMGAAQTGSDAELFLGDDTHDTADAATWSSFGDDFPVGVSATSLTWAATSPTLKVWASGEPMNVSAVVTDGSSSWSVTPTSCALAAGHECTLTVRYQGGSPTGTLTVTGPGGSSDISLTADGSPPVAVPPVLALTKSGTGTHRAFAVHLQPSAAGTVCRLEIRRPGRWTQLRSTRLGAAGRHTFHVTLAKGRHRLRALAGSATSRVRTVTVR